AGVRVAPPGVGLQCGLDDSPKRGVGPQAGLQPARGPGYLPRQHTGAHKPDAVNVVAPVDEPEAALGGQSDGWMAQKPLGAGFAGRIELDGVLQIDNFRLAFLKVRDDDVAAVQVAVDDAPAVELV